MTAVSPATATRGEKDLAAEPPSVLALLVRETGAEVRGETIEGFLHRLAERAPAPGGGAVAALGAAHAAALVGMAARFTTGPRYAEVSELAEGVAAAADVLRDRAVDLAVRDEQAFTAVAAAYRLPRDSDGDRRTTAIRDSVAEAAHPPAAVVAVARELVGLAERLRPVANTSVLGDLAAAADATYAAASTARVNVEANLRGLPEGDARRALFHDIADVEQLLERALEVRESVREELCT